MAVSVDQSILDTAATYIEVLRDHDVDFESAWLFGSFALNAATEDSDIDIAVVMRNATGRFYEELELMKYRREVDSRIDPHVLLAADLDTPFCLEITKNGIRIA